MKRWVLEGTDYVYPRTTNKILEAYLKSKGVAPADLLINYTPFGYSDWQAEVAKIKAFGSAGKKTAVVSTINGDANVPFYKELGNQGIKATDIPVVAFSVGEQELAGIDTKPLVGHLAAWNYFQSVDTPLNKEVVAAFKTFAKDDKRVFNDPMEAHYIGFNMWVKAVEKAGTTDHDAVIDAMVGVAYPNLSGDYATMMPNHHLTKPVLIGEVQGDGHVQHRVADPGPGRRSAVVALPAGKQEPDRRLAAADVLRQLRRGRRQVPRDQKQDLSGMDGRRRRPSRRARCASRRFCLLLPLAIARRGARRGMTRSRRSRRPISTSRRRGCRRSPSPAIRAPPRSSTRCATASCSPGNGRGRTRRSTSRPTTASSMPAPATR